MLEVVQDEQQLARFQIFEHQVGGWSPERSDTPRPRAMVALISRASLSGARSRNATPSA
jgi:hypothetical protein